MKTGKTFAGSSDQIFAANTLTVRALFAGLMTAAILSVSPVAQAQQCEGLFLPPDSAPAAVETKTAKKAAAPKRVKGADIVPEMIADKTSTLPAVKEPSDLKKMLARLIDLSHLDGQTDQMTTILSERRQLVDMLASNADENIAIRSPLNVMNAAQRMLAMIYSQGVEKTRLPISGEAVEKYRLFSAGVEAVGRQRIVGNEKTIDNFVDNLKGQAEKDRAGVSLVLLVGSHGTGKSEFLKLLGKAGEYLTTRVDPTYALYTYTWTRLEEIPELHKFFPSIEVGGKRVLPELPAPLSDSPYVLLPPEVQKVVLQHARDAGAKMLNGMEPSPFATPDPISNYIRNAIIAHYSKVRGRQLSVLEIVEVMNNHTFVHRQPLGQAYNKMPLIDAQGQDIDVQGLMMSPNPAVKMMFGPNHVLASFLNGKILSGHGNAVMFDEWLRNPKEFRDMLLGAFESRTIQSGGSPTVPFDAVLIAATNTANLVEVKQDLAGHAGVDRFNPEPMRWSVLPGEIAKVLAYGKEAALYQQKLGEKDAPVEKANLDELFPAQEGRARVKTTDYRYRVWFGKGSNRVEVSPHALMLMAEIIAATRYEINPEKAQQVRPGKLPGSELFRSPVHRLQFYEGLKTDVQSDEVTALLETASLLNEGESGISARDAGRWLGAAIRRAQKEGHNTLTPAIVIGTFRERINGGKITFPSNKERLRWISLANEVMSQMIVPRLNGDISNALANGDRAVNAAYYDILDEMIALHDNPSAPTFTSRQTNQEQPIDRKRLEEVNAIYRKATGRPLAVDQIAIFHARQKDVEGGRLADKDLLDAIAKYYAEVNTRLAGIQALLEYQRTGIGDDNVKHAHSSLISAMREMGYNDAGIRAALMVIEMNRRQTEQHVEPTP